MNDMKGSMLGGGVGAGASGDLTQRFALDVQGFDALRRTAHDDPAAATKGVAKQVDASFLQMMLKSMRDATPSNGVMDSQDGKTYTGMLDQQLAQELSSKGVGLADSLLKQLGSRPGAHGEHKTLDAQPLDHGFHAANGAKGAAGVAGAAAPTTQSAKGGQARRAGEAAAAAATAAAARSQHSNVAQNTKLPQVGHLGPQALGAAGAIAGAGAVAGAGALRSASTSAASPSTSTSRMSETAVLASETSVRSSTTSSAVADVEARARALGWKPAVTVSAAASVAVMGQHHGSGNTMAGASLSDTHEPGEMHAMLNNPRMIKFDAAFEAHTSTGTAAGRNKDPLVAAGAFEMREVPEIRGKSGSDHVNAFIEKLAPAAEAASRETGIPAHFILSQVALESGWGRSEIRTPSGARTHNVLGIKAGADWDGPTVVATTTEYTHGRPHRVRESFRAYGSYDEALADYANVLKSNTRFHSALRASNTATGFANGMQKAGYATDPHYARKLLAIIKQMV